MSDTPRSNTSRSTVLRSLLIATMAVVVVSLQVGSPWLSRYLVASSDSGEDEASDGKDPPRFWRDRFSFERFLNPTPGFYLRFDTYIASATVHEDEILVLMHFDRQEQMIDRINLRTGKTTFSTAPEGIESVVSDGHRLWQIPNTFEWDFCLFEGRPVRFERATDPISNPKGFRYQLAEFEMGSWQRKPQFVLVPFSGRDAHFDVDRVTGKLCCFADSGFDEEHWFRYDLPIYSEEGYVQALQRHQEIAERDSAKSGSDVPGWRKLPDLDWRQLPNSFWVERNVICTQRPHFEQNRNGSTGRLWIRCFDDGRVEHQFVSLPLVAQWDGHSPNLQTVKSADGNIYLVYRSTFDGRWSVYRWSEGRLIRIVDQRSPLLVMTCVDMFSFVLFAVFIPTAGLVLMAAWIQRRWPLPDVMAPHAVLASIGRRSLAKGIDVACWGLPLLLSIILHPEFVEWRCGILRFHDEWYRLGSEIVQLAGSPTWQGLLDLRHGVLSTIMSYFPLPILWPLAFVALAIVVGQTLWQSRFGYSLGEYLLGIRVVRSDLRRCSWGRCLLREALFLFGTLVLSTWVPGVVSMLATSKSQRIGDWVTDTVVVRVPAVAESAKNAEA